jgi:tetratricopeptide (TPR) repeat protein
MYLIRGSLLFRSGKIEQSLPDFDKVIEIDPAVKPYLWQRGIALYYAGKYQEGLDQFAVHRDVNPNDVENAFWHFLCNTKLKGLKAAQKDVLLSGKDQRVPMMQVQEKRPSNKSSRLRKRTASWLTVRTTTAFMDIFTSASTTMRSEIALKPSNGWRNA